MIRTQIQLDEAQAEGLRKLAAERGMSLAALVREAVNALLRDAGREEKIRRALALGGKFSSGLRDVSVEHDRYLAEDYLK
jgi:hypothetical protein